VKKVKAGIGKEFYDVLYVTGDEGLCSHFEKVSLSKYEKILLSVNGVVVDGVAVYILLPNERPVRNKQLKEIFEKFRLLYSQQHPTVDFENITVGGITIEEII